MEKKENEYKNFSLEKLEEILNELAESKVNKESPFFVNEGQGFIPLIQSKIFDKYMRKNSEMITVKDIMRVKLKK